jgi:molybdopterin-binding protein
LDALIFVAVRAVSAAVYRDDGSRLLTFEQAERYGMSVRRNGEGVIMRISARNQIKGVVVDVRKGVTTSHVRVDIGGGQIVTSAITNEAVDELNIKAKDHVMVVIKASDVMIAVD